MRDKKPEVSIIIPTYNRAADLYRCLDSLVAQTFQDFEVLVCDDGSTDHTEEVVASYSDRLDLHFYPGENFGGAARARNCGIQHAKAEVLAFLDSDDWWTPDKLNKCLPFFRKGADVVYHTLIKTTNASPKTRRALDVRQVKKPVYDDLLWLGNTLPNSGTMARTQLIRAVDGFRASQDLIAWEDYDCWLRLARITDNFVCVPLPLGYYWIGGGNISTAQRILENLDAMQRLYFPNSLPFWYFDQKAGALFHLGDRKLAFQEKIHALRKAPSLLIKWRILKVGLKWLIFYKK